MTEKEIIQGCINNDNRCQKELYDRYAPGMYFICLRYAVNKLEAQDILQESFIKVFDKIDTYRGDGTIGSWIKTIIVRTAIKTFNSSHNQHEKAGYEGQFDKPVNPSAVSRLTEKEILQVIKKLPEGYRTVFNLYAIEGYKHKEIADMLGIGESTSRSQLVKAKRMLRSYLSHLQALIV